MLYREIEPKSFTVYFPKYRLCLLPGSYYTLNHPSHTTFYVNDYQRSHYGYLPTSDVEGFLMLEALKRGVEALGYTVYKGDLTVISGFRGDPGDKTTRVLSEV